MEIQAAIQSLSTIKSIADGLIAMRDQTKVLEVKLALMQQVFEIRQAIDGLQDEVATLKQSNRQLEQHNQQLQEQISKGGQTELFEVVSGVFVLAAKPVGDAKHAPPYFCQACQSDGKQSVLTFTPPVFGFDPGALSCSSSASHAIQLAHSVTAKDLGFRS